MNVGRLLVLGRDVAGRSCVIDQRPLETAAIPGVPGTSFVSLFTTEESPPLGAGGNGSPVPGSLGPGLLHWYIVDHEPLDEAAFDSAATDLHWKDALECVLVMTGGGELLLDSGSHLVAAGDCIVMPGCSHGLRTGRQGCRLMAFAVGTAPTG